MRVKRAGIMVVCLCLILMAACLSRYLINQTPEVDGGIIRNCKYYLWKQSPMNFIKLDFKKVTVKKATKEDQEQAESVIKDTKPVEGNVTVQIGDTRGHDFRILLIESNTKKVVGQIAIK